MGLAPLVVVDAVDIVVVVEPVEEESDGPVVGKVVESTVVAGATDVPPLDSAPLHAVMDTISNTAMTAIDRLAVMCSPLDPPASVRYSQRRCSSQ